ncbi:uncharacterized protein [Dermacentor albipictus]|uniref:uncharacterized protein isoform X2 n=1 Tax=Dermacentor albipictus TaxID=60249 RepID=UPI0031FBE1AB
MCVSRACSEALTATSAIVAYLPGPRSFPILPRLLAACHPRRATCIIPASDVFRHSTANQEPPTGVQPGIARGRGVRTDAVGHRFRSHLTSDARGMPEIWDCGAY